MPAAKFWDGTTWQTIAAVQGPQGVKGDPGSPGPQGPQGATGGNATVPMDPWHPIGTAGQPAFAPGWSNYGGAGAAAASFRKDPLGKVRLRGLVVGGGTGTVFTLPAGYRPPADYYDAANATNAFGTVVVNTGGAVIVTTGTASFVSLDGIEFDTDSVTQMPTGPKGDPGAIGLAGPDIYVQSTANLVTTVPSQAWTLMAMPTALTITSSDGSADFTRNADGSLTINKAGNYHFDTYVIPNVALPDNTNINTAISRKAGALPALSDNWASGNQTTGTQGNNYAITNISTDLVCVAGDRIAVYCWQSSAPVSMGLHFNAHKTGGAKGDPGAPGAAGGNATVPMDPWHNVGAAGEPALLNNWAALGSGFVIPAFTKDPLGRVQLRGSVYNGTQGNAAFILPNGYRPVASMRFAGMGAQNATSWAQINVGSDGTVAVWSDAAGTFVSLDQIEFDTGTVTAMPTGPQGPQGVKGDTGGNATVPMDTWHTIGATGEPTFVNSWTHYGAPFSQVGFHKNPLGRVQLRGMALNNDVIGTQAAAMVLPSGYRPPGQCYFTCPSNISGGVLKVMITTAGVVYFDPIGIGTWVDLSEIEFDTATVTAMPTGPQGVKGDTGGNATVPLDTWHRVGAPGEPTFQGAWRQLDAVGGRDVAFTKDPLGRVMLTGVVAAGVGGTLAFTLPVGYRPRKSFMEPLMAGPSANPGQVSVDTNGGVYPGNVVRESNVTISDVSAFAFLDGVIFDTGTITEMPTGPTGPTGPIGVVQEEGTALPARSALNFIGPNIRAVDDAANVRTNVTVSVPLVTALPSSPIDGQECYFQAIYNAGADSVTWHLRYRASSGYTYKWEVVGGSPIAIEVAAAYETTSSGTYVALATSGPSITLPVAGDWIISQGFEGYIDSTGSAWGTYMSYDIGATAAVDADNVVVGGAPQQSGASQPMAFRARSKNGLGAVALVSKYKVYPGGTIGHFQKRSMSAMPIRVG